MTARLEESLQEGAARGGEGRARRTFGSLKSERGYVAVTGPVDRPELLRICPWERVTWWKRVTATGGDAAVYERTDAPGPVLIIDQNGEYLAGGGR